MKTGAHVEIIGRDLPYETAFPTLKKLGAEGVELVYRENGILSMKNPDKDFIQARKLAEDCGLSISGMTNGYAWSKPMTSNSAETRQKGHEALRRALEAASLLGSDEIQVVPGYSVSSFVESDEKVPVETALKRATEELQSVSDYAAMLGISINVEVVWNGMLRKPEEMKAFLDGVNSPKVGFFYDTGNVYPEGDPVGWVRILGKKIGRVHIKDFIPGLPGLDAFGRLGTGVVNFEGVIRELKNAGYDGWLGAEHHINRNLEEAGHSLRFIKKLTEI